MTLTNAPARFALTALFCAQMLVSTPSYSQTGDDVEIGELASATADLDRVSRQRIGVGLIAFSLLLEAQPGTLLLEAAVRDDNRVEPLSSLISAGLVQVFRVETAEGTMLRIERTPRGEAVASALQIQKAK